MRDPTIVNVAVTSADTEYTTTLPVGTFAFSIHLRDGAAFRFAFVTGKVAIPTAPYYTVLANDTLTFRGLAGDSALPIYFACTAGTKVAEIIYWVR